MTFSIDQALPTLRHVETFEVEIEGRRMVAIKDPQRYATAMLTLEPGAMFILAACDGKTTMGDLSRRYREQTGQEMPLAAVTKVIDVFERHYFFASPAFQIHRKRVDTQWRAAPVRPAAHFDYAEKGKEREAWDELRFMLNDHFRDAGYAPGPEIETTSNTALALIAPHIDFMRGGRVWAKAYGEFIRSFQGDTVIIVGTNHQPHRLPVSMTRKDFDTPFGVMSTDEELADDIAHALPIDPFEDELPHRVEHSVELAAVMLAYLRPNLRIVPILVGGARHIVEGRDDSSTDEALADLAVACREAIEDRPGEVALIASADLAHVGEMFGDEFKVDQNKAAINAERDLEMLAPLADDDPAGFVQYIAEEKDVRKVCGLSPIYVVAAACERPFQLLEHDTWVDPHGAGMVSYAALIARR